MSRINSPREIKFDIDPPDYSKIIPAIVVSQEPDRNDEITRIFKLETSAEPTRMIQLPSETKQTKLTRTFDLNSFLSVLSRNRRAVAFAAALGVSALSLSVYCFKQYYDKK